MKFREKEISTKIGECSKTYVRATFKLVTVDTANETEIVHVSFGCPLPQYTNQRIN